MKQEETLGRGSLCRVGEMLSRYEVSRIMLVTSRDAYASSGAEAWLEPALRGKVAVRFYDFEVNPKFEDALWGTEVFLEHDCDMILAVGGGSVIDIAKCINIFQAHPGQARELARGERNVRERGVPLAAVPTTAGTGSEATHFAVIYVEGVKYSLAHEHVLPALAIVDSQLTDHLPAAITASTGFDALCQAVESYWSVGVTAESRRWAAVAIREILESIEGAVNSPSQRERDRMMLAANLAGKSINVTKTTAPHALSYTITSKHGIPHGHAVALTLGYFFELNESVVDGNANHSGGATAVKRTMADLKGMFGVSTAGQCKDAWYDLMGSCGLEYRLPRLGVCTRADLEHIVDNVNLERLGNHPVKLDRGRLLAVLESHL